MRILHILTELSFLFYKERMHFGAPLNAYQTDTWFVRHIYVFTVYARDGTNRASPLFPLDTILKFGENMPQCLKRS